MELPVNLNKSGFTLIEFLVAIVILMVGLLALLQTVNYAHISNMGTQFRNEAVVLADEQMVIEMSKSFSLISTTTNNKQISRNFRNSSKTYSVEKTGNDVGDLKEVIINVSWTHKTGTYSHAIYSMTSNKE